MTRADLPPVQTRRWVASRKAAVVRGVVYGLVSQTEILKVYDISEEELHSWMSAIGDHSMDALSATDLKKCRQP